LSETEQLVLERCAVFPGSFGYDDATAVVGHHPLDAVEFARAFPRLLDRSLVSARRERVTSYHLLDSVRSFAGARLEERREASALRERHARWFVAEGVRRAAGLRGGGQNEEIAWYAWHWADLRAAAAWGVAHEPAMVGRLVGGVGTGWEVHGARAELFEWLDVAGEDGLAVGATELAGIAVLLGYSDVDRAVRTAARAAELAASLEEKAHAWLASGWTLAYRGDLAAAREQLVPAIRAFADLGDPWHRALAQAVHATVLADAREAIAGLQAAADAFGALDDRIKRANCLNLMGNRSIELGVAREEAHVWLREAAQLALAAGNEHEWLHSALFSARLWLTRFGDSTEVEVADSLDVVAHQLADFQVGFQRWAIVAAWRAACSPVARSHCTGGRTHGSGCARRSMRPGRWATGDGLTERRASSVRHARPGSGQSMGRRLLRRGRPAHIGSWPMSGDASKRHTMTWTHPGVCSRPAFIDPDGTVVSPAARPPPTTRSPGRVPCERKAASSSRPWACTQMHIRTTPSSARGTPDRCGHLTSSGDAPSSKPNRGTGVDADGCACRWSGS
jgi:tetratricopeptide (TPR) repeat protein